MTPHCRRLHRPKLQTFVNVLCACRTTLQRGLCACRSSVSVLALAAAADTIAVAAALDSETLVNVLTAVSRVRPTLTDAAAIDATAVGPAVHLDGYLHGTSSVSHMPPPWPSSHLHSPLTHAPCAPQPSAPAAQTQPIIRLKMSGSPASSLRAAVEPLHAHARRTHQQLRSHAPSDQPA